MSDSSPPAPAQPDHGMPPRVLVVDDESVIREILSDFLMMEGYQVLTAGDGTEAVEVLARETVHMVVSDLKMPRMDGLELLGHIREHHPELVTLIMTGYGTVETAIEAMKRGAFDYVLKPFKVEEVMHTVGRAFAQQRLRAENIELRAALSLYQLAGSLGDAIELAPTLRLVVDTVLAQNQAERVSVILRPDEDQHWEGASAGAGEPLTDADVTVEALSLTEAVVASNGRAFKYLRGSQRTQNVTSMMATPLMSQASPLGLLVAVREGGRAFIEGDRKLLTIIADRAAVAVHNAQLYGNLERSFVMTIEAFVTALEEKDRYTAGHSERVAEFALVTARQMGLSDQECDLIYQGGRVHDIGKLTLHNDELNKPAALTDEEFQRFRAHPAYGERLLQNIPTFRPVLSAVGGHHEKFDGSGYPRGLKGEDIPVMARIMSVADTYDAMTSHRAYRSALKHSVAVAELDRCAGTQFDPDVVAAFLVAIETWRDERKAAGREYPM